MAPLVFKVFDQTSGYRKKIDLHIEEYLEISSYNQSQLGKVFPKKCPVKPNRYGWCICYCCFVFLDKVTGGKFTPPRLVIILQNKVKETK